MQSAETVKNMTNKRNALDRVTEVEEKQFKVDKVLNELTNTLTMMGQDLTQCIQQSNASVLLAEAISEILGVETVSAKIEEIKVRRMEEHVQKQKEAVEAKVSSGELVKAEEIGDDSFVVGRDLDKEGKVLPPGRFEFRFAQLNQDFQEKLKGQKAGFVVAGMNDRSFEVLEVYNFVPKTDTTATA